MRPKLFDALPRFELDGGWRCRGDGDVEEIEMVREFRGDGNI